MGGWDWGFTSTSKKEATPKTTAAKPKKPVFSAADEAAEIEAIKLKAAAEIKAEQEEAKVPNSYFEVEDLRCLIRQPVLACPAKCAKILSSHRM